MASSRNAASSSTTRRSSSRWARGAERPSRSGTVVATCGIGGALLRRVVRAMVAARAPRHRRQTAGFTTIRTTIEHDEHRGTSRPAGPLRTVAINSGGGPAAPGGGGVERQLDDPVRASGAGRRTRSRRDQYRTIRRASQRSLGEVDPGDQDQRDAGDRHGDRERHDEPLADPLVHAVAKFPCCGSVAAHRPDDREANAGPERDDRAEHVQEQQVREQTSVDAPSRQLRLGAAAGRDRREHGRRGLGPTRPRRALAPSDGSGVRRSRPARTRPGAPGVA